MPGTFTTTAASLADLRQAAGRRELYAILDSCDEPRVPVKVTELGPDAASLYHGRAQEELPAIAPYLVRVDPAMLDWIAQSLWTDPWGVFAVSDAPLDALRTHFRRFLLVDAPDGERWYFRFYDPRVLTKFLPSASPEQVSDFFGPVAAFGWVDLDTYGVTLARPARFGDPPPHRPRVRYRKSPP